MDGVHDDEISAGSSHAVAALSAAARWVVHIIDSDDTVIEHGCLAAGGLLFTALHPVCRGGSIDDELRVRMYDPPKTFPLRPAQLVYPVGPPDAYARAPRTTTMDVAVYDVHTALDANALAQLGDSRFAMAPPRFFDPRSVAAAHVPQNWVALVRRDDGQPGQIRYPVLAPFRDVMLGRASTRDGTCGAPVFDSRGAWVGMFQHGMPRVQTETAFNFSIMWKWWLLFEFDIAVCTHGWAFPPSIVSRVRKVIGDAEADKNRNVPQLRAFIETHGLSYSALPTTPAPPQAAAS